MLNPHTIFHGYVVRHSGYAGATDILYLVEDMAEGETVYAVHPGGFFRYADTIHDAMERSDVIEFHSA